MKKPFLCIVTPVFDLCYSAFKLLSQDIKSQTFSDFIHVAISDGPSPLIKNQIAELADERFLYVETTPRNPTTKLDRFFSIVERRNYGIKTYAATRYLFLDADLKLLSRDYFQTLYDVHQEHPSATLFTKVLRGVGVYYPRFPIDCPGSIDISNYCFTAQAASRGYPVDFDEAAPFANDFRFFNDIKYDGTVFLQLVSAEKDGNRLYRNLQEF